MMSPTRNSDFRFVVFQKIQQQIGLTAARAEMNVGNEQRAVSMGRFRLRVDLDLGVHGRAC